MFYTYKWMIAIGRLEKFARTLATVNNISLEVIILDELVIFIFTIFIIIQLWNQIISAISNIFEVWLH